MPKRKSEGMDVDPESSAKIQHKFPMINNRYVLAEMSTSNIDGLQQFFETISSLCITNLPLFFTKTHLEIEAIDGSNIMLVYAKILPCCGDSQFPCEQNRFAPGLNEYESLIRNEDNVKKEEDEEEDEEKIEILKSPEDFAKTTTADSEREYYHLYNPEPVMTYVNCDVVNKFLRIGKKSDNIVMRVLADSPYGTPTKLHLHHIGENVSGASEIPLLDVDMQELYIPPMKPIFRIEMPSSTFRDIVKSLQGSVSSDDISMEVKHPEGEDPTFCISMNGDNGSTVMRVHMGKQSRVNFLKHTTEVQHHNDMRMKFSTRAIMNFTRMTQCSRFVEILLTEEMPVQLFYQVPDLGRVSFFLAPKIEND